MPEGAVVGAHTTTAKEKRRFRAEAAFNLTTIF
jgi:hypothetical protein